MNLLRNRLIGPDSRQFSTNSPAIRSQILEDLVSNIQFLVSVRQVRQPPSFLQARHGLPMHYNTWELIAQDAQAFIRSLPESCKGISLSVSETFILD